MDASGEIEFAEAPALRLRLITANHKRAQFYDSICIIFFLIKFLKSAADSQAGCCVTCPTVSDTIALLPRVRHF